jgi:hypothetical protein
VARKISASEIAADIKQGLSSYDLKQKYDLSQPQLKKVIDRLVDGGHISSNMFGNVNEIDPEPQMQEKPTPAPIKPPDMRRSWKAVVQNTRFKGLVKLVIGLFVAVGAGFLVAWIRNHGWELRWGGFISFSVPGAYGLCGLLELISGVPFLQLSRKWNELAGWQRGLLGTTVVILFWGLVIGGFVLWAYMSE